MAPHSSTLAWKIPWTEEPGRLQSTGLWRVGHGWATSLSRTGEGNGNPLQCSCLENPRDGGAWWVALYGVAQSRTQLKWLSSSSNIWKCLLLLSSQNGFIFWYASWFHFPECPPAPQACLLSFVFFLVNCLALVTPPPHVRVPQESASSQLMVIYLILLSS